MKVIGYKSIDGPKDSFGYMHAKLLINENKAETATINNIPNNNKIFVYSGFKQYIDSKFSENEFFEVECQEVDDFRINEPEACQYGAIASSASGVNGKITSIIITHSLFDPNSEILANSKYKPTKPCVLIFDFETSENPFIAGPFEPFNSKWDEKSKIWSSSFRAHTSTKTFRDLKPSHLYKLNLSDLPSDRLISADGTDKEYSNCVSDSLFNYMQTIKTESVDFIDDGALLRMLDATLDKDSSLGRKRR